jgi:catechol 2,3-dioxygenase-like lactoylglutathione lyase family enzyme
MRRFSKPFSLRKRRERTVAPESADKLARSKFSRRLNKKSRGGFSHNCGDGATCEVLAGIDATIALADFSPMPRLVHLTYLVRDYDEAIAWFTQALAFRLHEDTPLGAEKRWVLVGAENGPTLLLARAANIEQVATIGKQAGGRVFLFLETDDFARDHAAMLARGVRFLEAPRHESYGTVAVFVDLYGHKWDLIQRAPT